MKRGLKSHLWWNVLFVLSAAVIVITDQLSKNWILNHPGEQPFFEAGILRFIIVENTGSSFGLFQDQNSVLKIVAIIGAVLIVSFASMISIRYPAIDGWMTKLPLGLLLGGTLGNLIDRFSRGYVTDFIDVGFWPTFNVADSAMVVGVILMICYILFSKKVKEVFAI